MGISSHPPREFSLTSAGTKSPGQVKGAAMKKLQRSLSAKIKARKKSKKKR
jgi:hypothetical protein